MFEIGIIVKPQGIRGELRVLPTTDDPSRFELLIGKEIFLVTKSKQSTVKILSARPHKNIIIVQLEGVTTRNQAEELLQSTLQIPDDMALPLDEGEYFVRDLVGLDVRTENGEPVGKLTRVMQTNAIDVYVISPPDGDDFMIPAIKSVVLNVSLAEKKMTVRLMEGLRELTLGNSREPRSRNSL